MLASFIGGVIGALWRQRRYGADAIRAHRTRALANLVGVARARSTLWHERLAHLDPDAPINLAQIEPITKEELMGRFGASVIDGALTLPQVEAFTRDRDQIGQPMKGRYMIATTSGTTGRVGYFVFDKRDFAKMNGALMARVLRHRLIPKELLRFSFGRRYRMAMTIATGGHFVTKLVSQFRPVLTRAMVDMRAFSIMDPTEKVVHQLNLFRPHYLHGYPTFVEALAHERLQGRLAIDPEFISLGSEPFSLTARQAISRAFPRAQLSETYGATECLAIANQCSAGRLHVNEDLVIMEPVDATNRPVPVGVASDKVLVTNLVNRAQPLLRYEITDSVTLMGDDCPCGSPMASVRVEGRADDTIFLEDATGRFSAHPPVPFEALFLGVRGLRQYQLVHEAQNRLLVRVVAEPGAEEDLGLRVRETFASYLAGRGLDGAVRTTVEVLDEIPRQPDSHKIRQIYSEVQRPAT